MPSEFSKRVWKAAETIPQGKVTTYGLLAKAGGGGAQAARSITKVLSNAPDLSKIPFHRIVYSDGRVWVRPFTEGVGSALGVKPEYEKKRIKLYKEEGIDVENGKIKNFRDKLYTFGFK